MSMVQATAFTNSAGVGSGHPDVTETTRRALPNVTTALRFNPRSVARFIGDPLNAALNSSQGHGEEIARRRSCVLSA